jgi:hypothetical protein
MILLLSSMDHSQPSSQAPPSRWTDENVGEDWSRALSSGEEPASSPPPWKPPSHPVSVNDTVISAPFQGEVTDGYFDTTAEAGVDASWMWNEEFVDMDTILQRRSQAMNVPPHKKARIEEEEENITFDQFILNAIGESDDESVNKTFLKVMLHKDDDNASIGSMTPMDLPASMPLDGCEESTARSLLTEDLSSCAKRPQNETEKLYVSEITAFDIFLGRGERANRQYGNMLFHKEKQRRQPNYVQAKNRQEKMAIAQELVDCMVREYGSRFLEKDRASDHWYMADQQRVLEKAKQALREDFTPAQRQRKREYYAARKKASKELL